LSEGRAFWTVAPGMGEIRAEILPEPGVGQVRVRMLASGISRGTEALVFAGRVPVDQYETMRAPLMGGAFPFPVKYGYAAVGMTEAGGRVFVLHPHQDVFVAPEGMCVAVPDAVPTRRAVLAANMETALNIVWDAAPLAGERMLVVGAGVVGLLVASLLARLPGASVTVVDVDAGRAALAARFGCGFAAPEAVGGEFELVVHASGQAEGLRTALRCAAFEGRIVEASWFGDAEVALKLGGAFHARRLRIVSSQVGSVAGVMRGRRTHAQRLGAALSLLADDAYDSLLEADTAFAALPARMPGLLASGLCHVVDYPDGFGRV